MNKLNPEDKWNHGFISDRSLNPGISEHLTEMNIGKMADWQKAGPRAGFGMNAVATPWSEQTPAWSSLTLEPSLLTGCYKRYLNSMLFAVVPLFYSPLPWWLLLKLWLCEFEWNETFKWKFSRLLEQSPRIMYWELCSWKCKHSSCGQWNHGIPEMGQHLRRSPNPTPYSEQAQFEQGAEGCVHLCFGYLQGWSIHNLLGQPVPVFDRPHSKKTFLLCLNGVS